MTKKSNKKKKISFRKLRLFGLFVVFVIITSFLACNCWNNIKMINSMKKEKEELENKFLVLLQEKKELENDVLKLKDPDYIAKYVREKYYFSKDGELILKIDD